MQGPRFKHPTYRKKKERRQIKNSRTGKDRSGRVRTEPGSLTVLWTRTLHSVNRGYNQRVSNEVGLEGQAGEAHVQLRDQDLTVERKGGK